MTFANARLAVVALVALCSSALIHSPMALADSIESKSGKVIEGKVTGVDDTYVTLEIAVGTRKLKRKFRLSVLKAVTVNGERMRVGGDGKLVKGSTDPGGTPPGPDTPAKPGKVDLDTTGIAPVGVTRSKAEIDQIIEAFGRAAPSWYASTPLSYPNTLDLTWPKKPPKGPWNARKNVGQYVWSVINENESRWKQGIRFMHFMLDRHKADPEKRNRSMQELGAMYFRFFQDYARAAYWWQRCSELTPRSQHNLAECYFRLGSKAMAVAEINKLGRSVYLDTIKLWSDLGETAKALKSAELFFKGSAPHQALVAAGDACRSAGRFDEALRYYQRTLATPDGSNRRAKRSKQRAQASITAIQLFEKLDVKRVADGTYVDSSMGYEAPVEITAVVQGGRLTTLRVSKHREKQFYSAIRDTTAQILAKQSVKGVDATSRATITSEAIINATAKAISKGMR